MNDPTDLFCDRDINRIMTQLARLACYASALVVAAAVVAYMMLRNG